MWRIAVYTERSQVVPFTSECGAMTQIDRRCADFGTDYDLFWVAIRLIMQYNSK